MKKAEHSSEKRKKEKKKRNKGRKKIFTQEKKRGYIRINTNYSSDKDQHPQDIRN